MRRFSFHQNSAGKFTAVAVAILLAAGLYFGEDKISGTAETIAGGGQLRIVEGEFFGSLPKPVQPRISDPVAEAVITPKTKRIVIRRIPTITRGMQMPHSYWGDCTKCHLFQGGAGPGEQWKSPVGQVFEKISAIHKVGPPILPNSVRPHPSAGRCIKCHDIVIEVPV